MLLVGVANLFSSHVPGHCRVLGELRVVLAILEHCSCCLECMQSQR